LYERLIRGETWYSKNMDLSFYTKLVRDDLFQVRPSNLRKCLDLWIKNQAVQNKNWIFWRRVVSVIRDETEFLMKASLTNTWLGGHFFKPSIQYFFRPDNNCYPNQQYLVSVTSLRRIEIIHDPPKIFIPIPKFELMRSCARSDLDPFAYF
jgi:hypothetical protein